MPRPRVASIASSSVSAPRPSAAPTSLPPLKTMRRGNAANVEAAGRPLRAIGVELGDERDALLLARELIDERAPSSYKARTSPRRSPPAPAPRLGDRPRERFIVELERPVEQHRLAAFAAFRAVGGASGVDAIPCAAELAAQREMRVVSALWSLP